MAALCSLPPVAPLELGRCQAPGGPVPRGSFSGGTILFPAVLRASSAAGALFSEVSLPLSPGPALSSGLPETWLGGGVFPALEGSGATPASGILSPGSWQRVEEQDQPLPHLLPITLQRGEDACGKGREERDQPKILLTQRPDP